MSRRRWESLARPLLSGMALTACAWVPFLLFERGRDWIDLRTVAGAADDTSTLRGTVQERVEDTLFSVTHLGWSLHDAALLTPLITVLGIAAVVIAALRGRWRDPGFALPAAMLVSGVATQVATGQGERSDVLMVWLVPVYALAAWGVSQAVDLVRSHHAPRATGAMLVTVVVGAVIVVGTADLVDSIRTTPQSSRLSEKWRAARAGGPVEYDAATNPENSANRFYLPCDPPYDWGSEIWYLMEVLDRGAGVRAAVESGAYRSRSGRPCAHGSVRLE